MFQEVRGGGRGFFSLTNHPPGQTTATTVCSISTPTAAVITFFFSVLIFLFLFCLEINTNTFALFLCPVWCKHCYHYQQLHQAHWRTTTTSTNRVCACCYYSRSFAYTHTHTCSLASSILVRAQQNCARSLSRSFSLSVRPCDSALSLSRSSARAGPLIYTRSFSLSLCSALACWLSLSLSLSLSLFVLLLILFCSKRSCVWVCVCVFSCSPTSTLHEFSRAC